MRRRLLLLTVVAMVAVACGGGSDDGDSGGSGTGAACPVGALEGATEPVELTYWYGGLGAGLGDAMKTLIDQYNGSQEKVHVTGQFQGTYDEAADKYLTALRGGSLPDVVLLEDTRLQLMIDSKSVVPAQACIDAADYDLSDHLDAVVTQFTVDDELWPMPFNVSNPVLLYDRNDFTKAGLDPDDPPSTFDEVLAAARRIKASGAAKTGYAWDMEPWNVEQWFMKAGEPIVNNDNGRDGRPTEATINNATGKEIYEFVHQLFAEDLAINVGLNTSKADALLAVGKGDAAMTVATTASLGSIYAIQAAGQFTDVSVGVGPLYGAKAPDGGVTVGGGSFWMVGKGKSDVEKAAAWDFASWLNEPEQQARWSALTGYIPIRKAAIEAPEIVNLWKEHPTYRVAYDQLAASKITRGGAAIGPYKEFRDAIRGSLEALVLGKSDVAAALRSASNDIDEALTSYNERVGG